MAIQYSIQKMVSDGTLSTIALGIQYLQRNDIYMRVAGEETPQSGAPSGYTWSFINNTTLKILPVVPNGVEVVVYRRTDVDAMYNVYSQNAQFDEATIDENNQQLLYIAQEYLEQGIPGAGVDTIEFLRDDGTNTYYRIKRTDGSYSDEFTVPSAGSVTKILAREATRRNYAEVGYNLVAGSFEAGGTLVNVNDALLHESSGLAYKWGGEFQKVVPPKSTPATTGGVSSAGWLSLGDITLRDEVQQRLDTADANTAAFKANNGFNLVGRFLNLTTLKSALPTTAGDIVFVASAASTTASETHYGGGFFQSVARTGTDDGGVVIQPATGDFMWRRIGFDVPELVFWGVKPDTGMNNAPEILKAMTYVRSKKCTIKFPAGIITSNEALPIWSESSIIGQGRSVTRFIKLTNNLYQVAPGVGVDALCVCLPDVYNPSGYTMDTFCMRPNIRGISLERVSTTFVNKPHYGIWGHKLAGAHFSDMLVLGANIGFYSINCFLMIQEQVSYSGVPGSYAGVHIANTLTGSYGRSGTTCNFTQVGVGGYNYGFFIAGLDSTRLTQCDVEAISRASGEAQCVGYAWINPMNCTMANCYTEDVDGPQLTVTNANTVSIAHSLVVDNFNITPASKAFTQPTPLMTVDAAGLGALKVTFVGGDLRFAVAGTNNMLPPTARGANCKVTILGGITNTWSTSAGGVVTEL